MTLWKISRHLLIIGLTACTLQGTGFSSTPTLESTATATSTAMVPTSTPELLIVSTPALGTIVMDFVARMCEAQWSNSIRYFSCSGNPEQVNEGYVGFMGQPVAEGGIPTDSPALRTIPSQMSNGVIFGRYPPVLVRAGDRFRSTLACQDNYFCSVEFSLEYYDANGEYHAQYASWHHEFGGGPFEVDVDLSPLMGQSVDFVLAVRDLGGSPSRDSTLWIAPHIYRPQP